MSGGADPRVAARSERARSATLAQVLDEYLKVRRKLRPSTRREYRELLDRYLNDWLNLPVTRLTGEMVRQRHAQIAERAPGGANSVMRVLRARVRFAQVTLPPRADGTPSLPILPTRGLSATRAWAPLPKRQSHIEPSELPAWWSAVSQLQSVQSRSALQALLLTGLRVNELLRLGRNGVDLTRRELRIRESKTTAFTKPIGPVLAQILEAHMKRYPGDRVFAVSDLRAALKQVSKLGGKAVTPHDLRRTFVTVAEGLDISTLAVKRLVNHAISDVTAGYAQISNERLGRAATQIEAVIMSMANGMRAPMKLKAAARDDVPGDGSRRKYHHHTSWHESPLGSRHCI